MPSSLISGNDPLLRRLLAAADETARKEELERVMAAAQPVIDSVIHRFQRMERHFRRDELEDVSATVTLRIIDKIEAVIAKESAGIESFADYVATTTQNALNDILRRRYPEMTRLRRRVRELLQREEGMALWTTESGALCGRAEWTGSERAVPLPVTPKTATPGMCVPGNAVASLRAIFDEAGGPVAFDELAKLLANVWGIAEAIVVDDKIAEVAGEQPNQLEQYERRLYLERLWREVQALRPAQRAALLLNLRDVDGSNALALLVILQIASFEEIAGALEITKGRLAELWNGLPLDDRTIAELLGTTRQNVINLRSAARERLRRRLK